jgi:glycosyltransferase involved in cell wall biosynthesis
MEMESALGRHRLMRDRVPPLPEARSPTQSPSEEETRVGRSKVVCVGFLPPPVDGQRIITARMFDRLAGITVVRQLDLDRFRRFGAPSKLISALAVCLRLGLARLGGYSRLYLAPHSGTGLLYSCSIVLVSRLLRYRLFVHYHSYKNLASYSRLMRVFLALCGESATHIVLAPPMARDLQHLYHSVKQVRVLSNSIFIQQQSIRRKFGGHPLRVGHVSNLSKSKGLLVVVECMRRLAMLDPTIEFVLAGPADDEESKAILAEALRGLGGRLSYLGRLAEDQVRSFYETVDVFLFPSLYEHEAEPLVLIEAVSFGVPVIATDRGCIPYLLGPSCGRVLEASAFVDEAVEQITVWAKDPEELARASQSARRRFVELRRDTEPELEELLSSIAVGGHG